MSRVTGCLPDVAELWQQLSARVPLQLALTAGAPLVLTVEQPALEAAASLVDGLLQLSSAAPPPETSAQTAVQLECEVLCTLVVPQGPPCTLAARSIRAVVCSSLDSVVGSSAAAVAVGSVELTRPGVATAGAGELNEQATDGPRLLAHVGGQQQADGRSMPAAQLFAVVR